MTVDLHEVWRDKPVLLEMAAEVRRQALTGWKLWEVLLPPDLLWPMLEEVSKGMVTQWSPVLLGTGVQVGQPGEIALKFVLPELKTSPVKVQALQYHGGRAGDTVPVEVHGGHPIRV